MNNTQFTLTVEYTLDDGNTQDYIVDTITLENSMTPTQVERHLEKGWSLVRGTTCSVMDLCVVRISEFTQVDRTPQDKYHFRYSA